MKTRSVAITALLTSQEGISKAVEERQYEIGEDITFLLTYGNNVDAESSQLETFDVLPHNEDGRGTAFSGGYNVKAVTVSAHEYFQRRCECKLCNRYNTCA